MPNCTRAAPGEKELAALLRDDNGGSFYLTLAQIGKAIGAKSPHTARDWVKTLVPRKKNGRKVWLVSDVAHKLYYGEEEASA